MCFRMNCPKYDGKTYCVREAYCPMCDGLWRRFVLWLKGY